MVSMNPTSPECFSIAAEDTPPPGLNLLPPSPPGSPAALEITVWSPTDELNSKKFRKPYTITKSREIWSEPEHDKFLEALHLFDRDWKKIEAFIGSKTVIQIRSHAQKYFLKVQKSGSTEHLPPPRPKRKAAHPYPQKAPKTPTLPEATSSQVPFLLLESTLQGQDTASIPSLPSGNTALSCGLADVPIVHLTSTGTPVADIAAKNASSSIGSIAMTRAGGMNEPANYAPPLRVLPDFGQVYHFIGSVFDPEATDHVQRLKKMDQIDVETVLLLMRNLSVNLTTPGFQDHRKLLASYEIDSDKTSSTNQVVCGN